MKDLKELDKRDLAWMLAEQITHVVVQIGGLVVVGKLFKYLRKGEAK